MTPPMNMASPLRRKGQAHFEKPPAEAGVLCKATSFPPLSLDAGIPGEPPLQLSFSGSLGIAEGLELLECPRRSHHMDGAASGQQVQFALSNIFFWLQGCPLLNSRTELPV